MTKNLPTMTPTQHKRRYGEPEERYEDIIAENVWRGNDGIQMMEMMELYYDGNDGVYNDGNDGVYE
ncbi:hypothetical protein Glove_450g28 [Diversispora epigaea]|uniref:Uncharacterized protein n=1 Tax=Diversispora epigaea TaxID=1348612 RepID=A0A397GTZ9_9GLOM|nr:hypothetical protein Glove_450g28 [Diversispora epigaea]